MQQNAAVLKGIATTASEIKIEKPKPAPRPPAKRKAAAPVRKQPARPTRISARLSGIEADSEVEKRKLEMEAEEETERRKAKKMRNGDDLKLGDIAVDGRKFGGLDGIKDIFARGADPGVRTFTAEDVKEITDAGLKDLRERMSALELYEHWLPNGATSPLEMPREYKLADYVQTSRSPRRGYMPSVFIPPRTNLSSSLATKRAL